ncbi:MAG TPA: DNA-binding protein [Spirochaetia bacterium]|nr:DNA-binding protein [Spirochaetia bacterium]
MRCISERMTLDQAPDFFGPVILGRIVGLNANGAYDLVKRPDFPKIIVGRKYIIAKVGLMRWLEEQKAI